MNLTPYVQALVTITLMVGLLMSIWLDVPDGSLAVVAGLAGTTISFWFRDPKKD